MDSKNLLESENTLKLILKIAMPSLVSNIVMSLYYIIDAKFVSFLGDKALAAMSIIYPLNVLIFAISIGLGIGTTTIISFLIGKNNKKQAAKVAANILIFSVALGIIFTIIGLFFTKYLIIFVSSGDQLIDAYAERYLKVILLGSLSIFTPIVAGDILKGEGNSWDPMVTLFIGAIINIVLDPLLMFGFFNLGIEGAALATVISRSISGLVTIRLMFRKRNVIIPNFSSRESFFISISKAIKLGFSSFLATLLTASVVYFINFIASIHLPESLAFVGLMVTVADALILLPVYGLAQGLIPVASYSFSAKNFKKLKESITYGIGIGSFISILGGIIFIFSAKEILSSFIDNSDMINEGIKAFRILGAAYLFVGPTIAAGASFQAMGRTIQLATVASLRSLLMLVPLGIVMSSYFGIEGLWYSFLITELSVFTLIMVWLRYILKDIKNS